tara:strand:- start:3460 stop:3618 length:159 start_codon:yes stop_codon:yes gene_type:complete
MLITRNHDLDKLIKKLEKEFNLELEKSEPNFKKLKKIDDEISDYRSELWVMM